MQFDTGLCQQGLGFFFWFPLPTQGPDIFSGVTAYHPRGLGEGRPNFGSPTPKPSLNGIRRPEGIGMRLEGVPAHPKPRSASLASACKTAKAKNAAPLQANPLQETDPRDAVARTESSLCGPPHQGANVTPPFGHLAAAWLPPAADDPCGCVGRNLCQAQACRQFDSWLARPDLAGK